MRGCIEAQNSTIRITGIRTEYRDFLTRDRSADFCVEGVLIRDILEEPTWNDGFDLSILDKSRGHYSYYLGINALYYTSDGFLVLQRRSSALQTGGGNLGSSVAGSLQWRDVMSSKTDALLNGVRRETIEELGIRERELKFSDSPYTGMGLNLRHGRDPNLYVLGRLELSHEEISPRRRAVPWYTDLGRDAWEWDHLVLVPVEAVAHDGSLIGRFGPLLGDARHLRGALYAAAQNRDFQLVQQEWRGKRNLP